MSRITKNQSITKMRLPKLRKATQKDVEKYAFLKAFWFCLVFLFAITCALGILSVYTQTDVHTTETKLKALLDFGLAVTLGVICLKRAFKYRQIANNKNG
ncbi:hypothetical protein IX92_26970 (plasmid) [Vibrio coralliilyticus]|uniref:Uncharacterized protein n=1 Tax=Vibrio coralliilyticus TaxID=190893 RepID=A0AAN0SKW8_9VIBR|nr:hypothetical protein IX92_26970 [Vibrio coralliilyticus]